MVDTKNGASADKSPQLTITTKQSGKLSASQADAHSRRLPLTSSEIQINKQPARLSDKTKTARQAPAGRQTQRHTG